MVIKDTISSSQEQKQSSGESTGNTTGSEVILSNGSSSISELGKGASSNEAEDQSSRMNGSSSGSSEKITGSSSKLSSSSTGEVMAAPQNVMEAVEMECLTSKSSSSSDRMEKSEEGGEKESSQLLLTWTSQLKDLKQTSPGKVQSPLKKLSQERSPARATRRFTSPAKRGRGKTLENSSRGSQKLDEWLIKSPEKVFQVGVLSSQSSDKSSTDSSSVDQPPEVTVVEETQSPKATRSEISPNSQPIQETPPPPTNKETVVFGSNKGSTRKLFSKGTEENGSLDICEDSNIIPASPESKGSSLSIRVGTPVLKLKRLTEEEINHFSPRKGEVGFGIPRQDKMSQEKEGSVQDRSHEHDDFSDVLPLDEVPVSSSQGFDAHDKTQTSAGEEGVQMTSTENLFTPNESRISSQESAAYDPNLLSTFKSNCEGKEVLGTENLKLSQQSDTEMSEEKTVASGEKSSKEVKPQESGQMYDPKLESTLAQDTPRRGRKRKQETPKKLSPESSRPKRNRQGKGEGVKTPRGKPEATKRGKQKEGIQEKPLAKKDQKNIVKASECKVSGMHCTEENLTLKEPEVIPSQSTGNPTTEMENSCNIDQTQEDAGKEHFSVGVERQFDSEGLFLESSQGQNFGRPDKKVEEKSESQKNETPKEITAEEKGEKTPSSRVTGEIPPRKSTTKKKIEVAKKRSQKKGKKESESKTSCMSDSSEDDVPLSQSTKKAVKSKGNLEDKMNEVTERENDSKTNEGKDGETAKSESSDDNIPLSKICNKNENEMEVDVAVNDQDYPEVKENWARNNQEDNEKVAPDKGKRIAKKKFAPAKTSPFSNRLRSSQGTLRSGKPTRRSLSPRGSPKSLTLKKTVKRKSLDPNMLTTVVEVLEEQAGKPVKETEEPEKAVSAEDDVYKEKEGTKEQTSEDISDMLNGAKKVSFGETPTKGAGDGTEEGAFALFERNTDSKLVVVPRKFEKRVVARRSILKPSSPGSSLYKGSPLRKAVPFHPIKLGQIFAPSASPSASILKRRRLSGDLPASSPSPPSKVANDRHFLLLLHRYEICF